MRLVRFLIAVVLILFAFAVGWLAAKTGLGSTVNPASLTQLERHFTERMEDSALVGRFTVSGREDQPARPDRYDISSVEKGGDNRGGFHPPIRYRAVAVTLPIVVTMVWAGDTPMITLTDFT